MATVFCNDCGIGPGTLALDCSVNGCATAFASCSICFPRSRCASCGQTYCAAHIDNCTTCTVRSCCYCLGKIHGNPAHLAPKCLSKSAASSGSPDVIASHPRAKLLPWHSHDLLMAFDPPITLLTYRYSKAARANGTRPKDVQAEHFIPNSCFMAGTGRAGPTIPAVGNYSEDNALTYWVSDDQKAGTEHKYLTDRERAFCRACDAANQSPTLDDWLDFMQYTTAKSILFHRTFVGPVAGPSKKRLRQLRLHAAQQAAYALRQMMQYHFEHVMGASVSAFLKNGLAHGAVPPSIATVPQRFVL